jgi:hypothetical protein
VKIRVWGVVPEKQYFTDLVPVDVSFSYGKVNAKELKFLYTDDNDNKNTVGQTNNRKEETDHSITDQLSQIKLDKKGPTYDIDIDLDDNFTFNFVHGQEPISIESLMQVVNVYPFMNDFANLFSVEKQNCASRSDVRVLFF